MSEIKITLNSLENAILKDGQFVFGNIELGGDDINSSAASAFAYGFTRQSGKIEATGKASVARGYANIGHIIATGDGAIAEGYTDSTNNSIDASGYGAHAEGCGTLALANYAHTEGYGTIASNEAMTAIGKYNEIPENNELFAVGTGNSVGSRKTGFKIVRTGLNDDTCNAKVYGNLLVSNNTSIGNSITAKVNGVSDVYLGCPIGTVVMWAGRQDETYGNTPANWFLCNGDIIVCDTNYNAIAGQTILNFIVTTSNNLELLNLIDTIGSAWNSSGSYIIYKYNDNNKPVYYTGGNSWTDIVKLAPLYPTEPTNVPSEGKVGYAYKLPDLLQRFPLGAKNDTQWQCGKQTFNTKLGKSDGENEHKLTVDEMPTHNHNVIHSKSGSGSPLAAGFTITGQGSGWTYEEGNPTTIPYVEKTGNFQPHNNIPPYLAINFIIKYK